ncbi:MAG: hypothetical protein Q4B26_18210, partial [Eubacteriales bacterium]|nr:hypothetical protein [Eubacteriales bacterium]
MGLFSKSKNEFCPVCGNPVPKHFATKIKGDLSLCKNCSDRIRMNSNLVKMQDVGHIRQHLAYRDLNEKIFSSLSFNNQAAFDGQVLRIDTSSQFWYFSTKNDDNPTLYRFNELIDYTFEEDYQQTQEQITTETTQNKHGVMRSMVGGAVGKHFGGTYGTPTGALVGAMTGKKNTETSTKVFSHNLATVMSLSIQTSNPDHPLLRLNFLPSRKDIEVGSRQYNSYHASAQRFISILDQIKRTADPDALPVSQMVSQITAAPAMQAIPMAASTQAVVSGALPGPMVAPVSGQSGAPVVAPAQRTAQSQVQGQPGAPVTPAQRMI